MQLLGEVSAVDAACAKPVAPLVVAGAVARIGSVPIALFGTYKLFKKSPAAGVVGLLTGAVLWFSGGRLLSAAEAGFEACRKR